ncbi:GNAT family N-acetyltransferase [Dongia soli]|uniref:GNAT family N-acetyltransferase n=1 Tax=Dongia soli TaxID=600628 RepID=A0ABU5EF85_9PROT|nr:GNAT family N-acetyltransferase [Dongia soli]MDY0884587.1 GNAT family N-acetyltransferase [Dongia soli]
MAWRRFLPAVVELLSRMHPYPGLTYRCDDLTDPAKRVAWVELLQEIFGIDLGPFSALNIWPPDYRAFSYLDGEAMAANVSLRPMPMMIGGRRVEVGQIQSVATRPAYRRRGLFGDLMRRMLAEADRHYECQMLYTVSPDLYMPFGFRPLTEHYFRGQLHVAAGDAGDLRIERLDIGREEDRATILGLFNRRRPVSDHFGLCDDHAIFLANLLARRDWHLSFLPAEQALIVWEQRDRTTRLLDIVAPRIPPMASIAAALELSEMTEIKILFPPDRLVGNLTAAPYKTDDNVILMVRGPFAIEGTPFMLPPTAES